eukprot:gene5283-10573_t
MRGGRGGGRGGRFGRGSVTQDLVRDNMEDLGLDQRQMMSELGPPPLYPPISMQGPCRLSEDDLFCVQKMRDITHRFQSSPYHLVRKQEAKDIQRYSDQHRTSATKKVGLLDCINTSTDDAAKYIPFELLDGGGAMGGRIAGTMTAASDAAKRKDESAFLKLEQQERAGAGGAAQARTNADGKEDGSDNELELDADYGVDHYASDNDNSGDDAEATF